MAGSVGSEKLYPRTPVGLKEYAEQYDGDGESVDSAIFDHWMKGEREIDLEPVFAALADKGVGSEVYPYLLWLVRLQGEAAKPTLKQFFTVKNRNLAEAAMDLYAHLDSEGGWLLEAANSAQTLQEVSLLLSLTRNYYGVETQALQALLDKVNQFSLEDFGISGIEKIEEIKQVFALRTTKAEAGYKPDYSKSIPMLLDDPVYAWVNDQRHSSSQEAGIADLDDYLKLFRVHPASNEEIQERFGTLDQGVVLTEHLNQRNRDLNAVLQEALRAGDSGYMQRLLDDAEAEQRINQKFDQMTVYEYTAQEYYFIQMALGEALEAHLDELNIYTHTLDSARDLFVEETKPERESAPEIMDVSYQQQQVWFAIRAGLEKSTQDLGHILETDNASLEAKIEAVRWLAALIQQESENVALKADVEAFLLNALAAAEAAAESDTDLVYKQAHRHYLHLLNQTLHFFEE